MVAAPCTRPAAHRCRRLPANPLGIFDPACQGTFVLLEFTGLRRDKRVQNSVETSVFGIELKGYTVHL